VKKPTKEDKKIAALLRRIGVLEEALEQSEIKRSALTTPLGTPIRGSIVADLYPR
jgi:hypothetical protein